MYSATVDVITRRVFTGVPGQDDGMRRDHDRRFATEFYIAMNSLREAETQAKVQHHATGK